MKKGEKWGFTLLIEPEDDEGEGEEEPSEMAAGSGEGDGAQGGVAPGGEAATTNVASKCTMVENRKKNKIAVQSFTVPQARE